jgi:hypothetical protein
MCRPLSHSRRPNSRHSGEGYTVPHSRFGRQDPWGANYISSRGTGADADGLWRAGSVSECLNQPNPPRPRFESDRSDR